MTFPEIPEVITQGDNEADAMRQAQEPLGSALVTYLPQDRSRTARVVVVAVEPEMAVRLAVLKAFEPSSISRSDLARRIGRKEIRSILDPRHRTKPGRLPATLRAGSSSFLACSRRHRRRGRAPRTSCSRNVVRFSRSFDSAVGRFTRHTINALASRHGCRSVPRSR